MFKNIPPDSEVLGEYIVDFITDSGEIRASLFKESNGTHAHVYFKTGKDFTDGDPFFGPIYEYLMSHNLPKLSFMHMHYEK